MSLCCSVPFYPWHSLPFALSHFISLSLCSHPPHPAENRICCICSPYETKLSVKVRDIHRTAVCSTACYSFQRYSMLHKCYSCLLKHQCFAYLLQALCNACMHTGYLWLWHIVLWSTWCSPYNYSAIVQWLPHPHGYLSWEMLQRTEALAALSTDPHINILTLTFIHISTAVNRLCKKTPASFKWRALVV